MVMCLYRGGLGVMLGAVCFGCGVEKQLGEWSIGY